MAEYTVSNVVTPYGDIVYFEDDVARSAINSLTYTISRTGNRITLTGSKGDSSYIDLPVWDGSVE